MRCTMKPSTDGSMASAVKRADVGSKERIRGSTRSHAHCSRRLATPQGRARARRASAERLHRGFGYPVTPGEQPAQRRRRGRTCWGETRRSFAPARCRERVWRHAILRSGAYRNAKAPTPSDGSSRGSRRGPENGAEDDEPAPTGSRSRRPSRPVRGTSARARVNPSGGGALAGARKGSIVRNDADRARSWYERARSAAGWGEAAHAARERGRCAQGMGSTRVARAQASTPVCGDHAGASACAGGAPGRFTDHRAQEGPRQLGLIPDRL